MEINTTFPSNELDLPVYHILHHPSISLEFLQTPGSHCHQLTAQLNLLKQKDKDLDLNLNLGLEEFVSSGFSVAIFHVM